MTYPRFIGHRIVRLFLLYHTNVAVMTHAIYVRFLVQRTFSSAMMQDLSIKDVVPGAQNKILV